MEHGVGMTLAVHGFGQAGDGKEPAEEGVDANQVNLHLVPPQLRKNENTAWIAAYVANACQVPEPTQLLVEGMLMKLLAQSPDGTLMCCANETHLKFVDSRFLKLYETNTPGAIMAASFHPQKYELFLKIDNRTLVRTPGQWV